MNLCLILDTETTGLDPAKDAVIEVAAILYDLRRATPRVSFSSLIHATSNEAEAINRIPVAALAEAPAAEHVWARIEPLAWASDVVIAHNAEFDRGFVPLSIRDAKPWICSKSDLQWPKQTRPEPSLVALALEHDLGVAVAHRALADCDLIARLLTRAHELGADLEALLARGLRPKGEFVALVSYEDREKAKAAGFRWEAATKRWLRRMAVEDAAALPFQTRKMA